MNLSPSGDSRPSRHLRMKTFPYPSVQELGSFGSEDLGPSILVPRAGPSQNMSKADPLNPSFGQIMATSPSVSP